MFFDSYLPIYSHFSSPVLSPLGSNLPESIPMKLQPFWAIWCCLFVIGCTVSNQAKNEEKNIVQTDRLDLWDATRSRQIPVTFYFPRGFQQNTSLPVVIFSHGYGANKGGDNVAYSYLTNALAAHGYFVASIQHELPTDELLPLTGKPQEVRRPNWERGAQNILFVLKELKRLKPSLDYTSTTLIGHSNGGDMSMLFAYQHPEWVHKVISLDSRRMPFPRVSKPQLYSLRSSDQVADEGVLPTSEEQQQLGIHLVQLPQTKHNDMDDSGTATQHEEINQYILGFLKD